MEIRILFTFSEIQLTRTIIYICKVYNSDLIYIVEYLPQSSYLTHPLPHVFTFKKFFF